MAEAGCVQEPSNLLPGRSCSRVVHDKRQSGKGDFL